MEEIKKARYEEVKKVGEEILGLVRESQKLFQASEDSVHWHAYLDFIEEIITLGTDVNVMEYTFSNDMENSYSK